MTQAKHPDYEAMAREYIAEMEPKRGLVAAEREACEMELRTMRGEALPGHPDDAPRRRRQALAFAAVLGDEGAAAELASRLRAVLAGGDRASAFCYLRAAEGRLRGMAATPEGADEALRDLRGYLQGDARRGRISHARTRAAEAREVSGLVWALRRGGRNAGDVHALQGYGDVAERVAASG